MHDMYSGEMKSDYVNGKGMNITFNFVYVKNEQTGGVKKKVLARNCYLRWIKCFVSEICKIIVFYLGNVKLIIM